MELHHVPVKETSDPDWPAGRLSRIMSFPHDADAIGPTSCKVGGAGGVAVIVGTGVAVRIGVAVRVAVGTGVTVPVGVTVETAVSVGVETGLGVTVGTVYDTRFEHAAPPAPETQILNPLESPGLIARVKSAQEFNGSVGHGNITPVATISVAHVIPVLSHKVMRTPAIIGSAGGTAANIEPEVISGVSGVNRARNFTA